MGLSKSGFSTVSALACGYRARANRGYRARVIPTSSARLCRSGKHPTVPLRSAAIPSERRAGRRGRTSTSSSTTTARRSPSASRRIASCRSRVRWGDRRRCTWSRMCSTTESRVKRSRQLTYTAWAPARFTSVSSRCVTQSVFPTPGGANTHAWTGRASASFPE